MPLLLRRMWIQVTADRRRFGLLCAMVAVGMLLWARIIVTANLPRTATADPKSNPGATPAPGDTSDKRQGPPVTVKLARNTVRDPLVISDADFPKRIDVDNGAQDNGKSGEEPVENVMQAEQRLVAELKALASKLRLEGVLQGLPNPMAVINGNMYQLGEFITAEVDLRHRFKLVDVGDRWVTLESEGHEFRLTMDVPGSEKR